MFVENKRIDWLLSYCEAQMRVGKLFEAVIHTLEFSYKLVEEDTFYTADFKKCISDFYTYFGNLDNPPLKEAVRFGLPVVPDAGLPEKEMQKNKGNKDAFANRCSLSAITICLIQLMNTEIKEGLEEKQWGDIIQKWLLPKEMLVYREMKESGGFQIFHEDTKMESKEYVLTDLGYALIRDGFDVYSKYVRAMVIYIYPVFKKVILAWSEKLRTRFNLQPTAFNDLWKTYWAYLAKCFTWTNEKGDDYSWLVTDWIPFCR